MSQLALELIEKEKRERTGTLDLGNCGLRDWPEEVFETYSQIRSRVANAVLSLGEKDD